jgi:hypothetical protein
MENLALNILHPLCSFLQYLCLKLLTNPPVECYSVFALSW